MLSAACTGPSCYGRTSSCLTSPAPVLGSAAAVQARTIPAMETLLTGTEHGELPINDPPPSGKPEEQAPVKDPPSPEKEHEKRKPPQ